MIPTSIDSLKSTIGRRGGIARGNRFAIYITHPNKKQGLLNTDWTGIASNLLTSVTSGGSIDPMVFFNDPRDMFLLCDSAQLPGKRINTTERKTTHKGYKMAYSYMVEEVTFSFILTNDYYIKKYFDSWQSMIFDKTNRLSHKDAYTTDVVIQQMSSGNDFIPAYGVKLINAFPVAINAIELSNQSANDTLKVSITMAFDDWTEEGLLDSVGSLFKQAGSLLRGTLNTFT
jgi:hypothetical protein